MKYAIFSNLIVTTNNEGGIPLNAKVLGEVTTPNCDVAAAREMIRKANAHDDLIVAIENMQRDLSRATLRPADIKPVAVVEMPHAETLAKRGDTIHMVA